MSSRSRSRSRSRHHDKHNSHHRGSAGDAYLFEHEAYDLMKVSTPLCSHHCSYQCSQHALV
jgi:hypothetical protein